MKKILLFSAGLTLAAHSSGQGYWSPMIAGATGGFPNHLATLTSLYYHNNTVFQAGNLSETVGVNNNNVYAFNGTGFLMWPAGMAAHGRSWAPAPGRFVPNP